MSASLYLDHAATAPLRAEARAAMLACLDGAPGNPAAVHAGGQAAAAAIEIAAEQIAGAIGARADELVWTSGATEATNLALQGWVAFARRGQRATAPLRVVSCQTEHEATRETLRALEARGHIHVDWLGVDGHGALDETALQNALSDGVDLVSLMAVNNETGVIHDVARIAALCAKAGTPLHVDAAQSFGRLPIDVAATPIALMSLSAHKLGGPPGIGALYVRRRPRVALQPLMFGGNQQQGRRSGTLAAHQIAGFGAAVAATIRDRAADQARYGALRDRLWERLSGIEGVHRNNAGPAYVAAPFLNVHVEGVHGEALRHGLAFGTPGLAVSGGSACSAARSESSYVLRAMGHSAEAAAASLRFSIGPGIDDADIEQAANCVAKEIDRLRYMACGVSGR